MFFYKVSVQYNVSYEVNAAVSVASGEAQVQQKTCSQPGFKQQDLKTSIIIWVWVCFVV